jgi:hypothetical protein
MRLLSRDTISLENCLRFGAVMPFADVEGGRCELLNGAAD